MPPDIEYGFPVFADGFEKLLKIREIRVRCVLTEAVFCFILR